METVTLTTGGEMPKPLVLTTWVTLQHLMQTAPVVLFDAVEMARTGQPQFNAAKLEAIGVTQGGRMHDATRDIILADAEGEGMGCDSRTPSPDKPLTSFM